MPWIKSGNEETRDEETRHGGTGYEKPRDEEA